MIAVIVAFILLTVPHAVAYTVDIVGIWIHYYTNVGEFHDVLILLRDINYSINLFIYAAYIPTHSYVLLPEQCFLMFFSDILLAFKRKCNF